MNGLLYVGKSRNYDSPAIGFVCRRNDSDYKSESDWINGIKEIYSRCSEVYSIRICDSDNGDEVLSELRMLFPDGKVTYTEF